MTVKRISEFDGRNNFIGSVGSNILAITLQASPNVGIRKNIHAKLTSRNVMIILTPLPKVP